MGVQGLWEHINHAGQPRSLAHLAIKDGFEENKSAKRAYRVGVDVSIWFNHAKSSVSGENPQLRFLFFRLKCLCVLPILPLFMFDGNNRPKSKRGSKKGKSGSHPLSAGFKEMVGAFGMEYRVAPGEAEAELAYLNTKGYIDAILTDDCDALVFGARTVIKNWSAYLSGNKANEAAQQNISRGKSPNVTIYSADRMQLSRGSLILFALLSGGDYDDGVEGFGPVSAIALARCGFGDELLEEYKRNGQHILPFLARWRDKMNTELATNSQGHLSQQSRIRIPDSFPNLKIVEYYVNPVSNAIKDKAEGGGPLRDRGQLNIKKLAEYCEKYFEWGYSRMLITRFRNLMWLPAVMHVLRRAALEADEKERAKRARSGNEDRTIRGALRPSAAEGVGTPAGLVQQYLDPPDEQPKELRLANISSAFVNQGPSSSQSHSLTPPRATTLPDPYPLISKIVGTRNDPSTGGLLEYRVEICPVQLVAMTKKGIRGFRQPPAQPPKPTKTPPPLPDSMLRLWVPASMLHQVHPGLVEEYAMREEEKNRKKTRTGGKRKVPGVENDDGDVPGSSQPTSISAGPPARATQQRQTISAPAAPRPIQSQHPHPLRAPVPREYFLFTFADPDRFEPEVENDDDDAPTRFEDANVHLRGTAMNGCGVGGLPQPQDDDDGWERDWESPPPQPQPRASASASASSRRKPQPKKNTGALLAAAESLDDDYDVDMDEEANAPPTARDVMWDSLIGGTTARRAKSKAKPKAKPRGRPPKNAPRTLEDDDDASSNRIRPSDGVVVRLDKLVARKAAKRRRLDLEEDRGIEMGTVVPKTVAAFPSLPDVSGLVALERRQQASGGGRRVAPWEMEPSSSQDSRLSSQGVDGDVIDLTL